MKKILALMFLALPGFAAQRVTPTTGDYLFAYKVAVSSSVPTTVLTYSSQRSRAVCVNNGTNPVYIGTSTAITANGSFTFVIGPGTSTLNTYEMFNTAPVIGIATVGDAAGALYCIEEK